MPDVATVKRELTRLAEGADHRPSTTVETAASAVESLELAAAFADEVGIARLRRAVERVDDRALERTGQRALATFERFREAARTGANATKAGANAKRKCATTSETESGATPASEQSRNAFRLRMQSTNE